MSTFDPDEIRRAVAEFTPRRPQKFQDLIPAKDVIVELRQKQASYRSISELLDRHCLPTSKTAIAAFYHQVLGEAVRPRKRLLRKRPVNPLPANNGQPGQNSESTIRIGVQPETPAYLNGEEPSQPASRGPRVAQIRKLSPLSNEKTDSHS